MPIVERKASGRAEALRGLSGDLGDEVEVLVEVHDEDVPSSVELRWRPDDDQAAFTVSS